MPTTTPPLQTTLIRRVTKECPHVPETDDGDLVIVLAGPAPELHALGAAIDALSAAPITHEEYTARIAAILPAGGLVTTTWTTGPWDVVVEAATGPAVEEE